VYHSGANRWMGRLPALPSRTRAARPVRRLGGGGGQWAAGWATAGLPFRRWRAGLWDSVEDGGEADSSPKLLPCELGAGQRPGSKLGSATVPSGTVVFAGRAGTARPAPGETAHRVEAMRPGGED
jgi:hypothetical protein